jgi:cell division protein FtsA
LSRDDRQRGAVLIDVGGEAMHASVYRDGGLRGLVSMDAGSAHVTRDLSWALRIRVEEAEELKCQHGVAAVQEAQREVRIPVCSNGRPSWVGQRAIAQVIEPRFSELLTMARDGLRAQDALFPAARVVLTGNGSRMPGLLTLAERIFETPAQTATFLSCEEQSQGLIPSCVAAGLVQYVTSSGLATPPRRRRQAMQWLMKTIGAGVSQEATGLRAGSETAGATSTQ